MRCISRDLIDRLDDCFTFVTGPLLLAGPEIPQQWLQLAHNIGQDKLGVENLVLTFFTVDKELILDSFGTLTLDHHTHSTFTPLWRMGNPRRQQKDISFADMNVSLFFVFLDPENHVSL